MASILTVYNALKSLANKDQRGFITPAIFNNFAGPAQLAVFNKLFSGEMTIGNMARGKQMSGDRETSQLKNLREDLSILIKESTITQTNATQDFTKPTDLGRFISMKTFGSFVLDETTSVPIDVIYDPAKIEYILRSKLSLPTESKPIASVSDRITVYPLSIKRVKVLYYKIPQSLLSTDGSRSSSTPVYAYTTASSLELFNATNSRDFELPEQYIPELVLEIAKMVGVNLRDSDVYAYANSQSQQQQ
jgi:hypothetical protein